MKEMPIIFSPPMVKAILQGTKTQTRRIIKTPPCEIHEHGNSVSVTKPRKFKDEEARFYPYEPYCVGDILWVREKFCNVNKPEYEPDYYYFADTLLPECEDYESSEWTWKPSIHMPRDAARIFLEIKKISVGRVQDIGEKDAQAEGIRSYFLHKEHGGEWHESSGSFVGVDNTYPTRKKAFAELWDSINSERGFSWESNPWVWVIEFRRNEKQ